MECRLIIKDCNSLYTIYLTKLYKVLVGIVSKVIIVFNFYIYKCYGPSVISVTVTTGGHLSGSRLYGTSGTIGRGVTKLCKKFST